MTDDAEDYTEESGGLRQTAQAQRDVAALQVMALKEFKYEWRGEFRLRPTRPNEEKHLLTDATRNGTGWTICGRQ
jgi:hypothetical protein